MTNLKRIRTAQKITQAALAEKANVNLRVLQDYEQGRKPINGAAAGTVYKLSKALNVNMEDIIEQG